MTTTEDIAAIKAALDHIEKVCKASRSQTRRLRWIELRAHGALHGLPDLHHQIDLPKSGGPETSEKLSRRLGHEKRMARVAQGLTAGICLAALEAAQKDAARLKAWKAKVILAAEQAHGPDAIRFKFSLRDNGTARNVFPASLDQRWVSFVYAEDDAHIGYIARAVEAIDKATGDPK